MGLPALRRLAARHQREHAVGHVSGLVINVTATELSFPAHTANQLDYMTVFPDDAPACPTRRTSTSGRTTTCRTWSSCRCRPTASIGVFNFNGFTHYLGDVSAVVLAN